MLLHAVLLVIFELLRGSESPAAYLQFIGCIDVQRKFAVVIRSNHYVPVFQWETTCWRLNLVAVDHFGALKEAEILAVVLLPLADG